MTYKHRSMEDCFKKEILLIILCICWTNIVKLYKMHGTYIKTYIKSLSAMEMMAKKGLKRVSCYTLICQ